MVRKKDVLVIALVLLLALGTYGVMQLSRRGQVASGEVAVYVDGVLHSSGSLGRPQTIRVEQETGEVNIIRIEDGGVHMEFSSCKNQLCLQQGTLTADNWPHRAMGRSIICLPNTVLVELVLDEAHPSMQDPDAPDI